MYIGACLPNSGAIGHRWQPIPACTQIHCSRYTARDTLHTSDHKSRGFLFVFTGTYTFLDVLVGVSRLVSYAALCMTMAITSISLRVWQYTVLAIARDWTSIEVIRYRFEPMRMPPCVTTRYALASVYRTHQGRRSGSGAVMGAVKL